MSPQPAGPLPRAPAVLDATSAGLPASLVTKEATRGTQRVTAKTCPVCVLCCYTGVADLTAPTARVTEVTLIAGVPAKAADIVENVPLFDTDYILFVNIW